MRSRYSAFSRADVGYLERTQRDPTIWAETATWAASVTWLSLRITDRVLGGEADVTGEVEFVARSLEAGQVVSMHERSRFSRNGGAWRYDDAVSHEVTKEPVERNARCPCGSGRKFKQCHA
jgi:SEC-C motif domain protein